MTNISQQLFVKLQNAHSELKYVFDTLNSLGLERGYDFDFYAFVEDAQENTQEAIDWIFISNITNTRVLLPSSSDSYKETDS